MAVSLPFIKWRDGRPRFVCGPRERALGFRDQDLRHPDGRWFTYEEAEPWAARRHGEIVAARANGRKPLPPVRRGNTVADLIENWFAAIDKDPDMAASSKRSYRKAANAILYLPETRTETAARRRREAAHALLGQPIPERPRETFARVPVAAIGAPEQAKTGALVAIPEAPRLAERLAQAKARTAALKLQLGLRDMPRTIVVDETTARPYVQDTYRHAFTEVRAAAIAACPSIAGKRDQDLRDTVVTWLARAGCTLPEIAAITGHSLRSIHNVLKHYLAITPELADSAISKLVAWMDREGMAVERTAM